MRRLPLRPQPLLLLALIVAAEYGSPWRFSGRLLTVVAATLLTAGFARQSFRNVRLAAQVRAVLRTRLFELALTAVAVALLASKVTVWVRELTEPDVAQALDQIYRQYAGAFLVVAALRLVAGEYPIRRVLHRLDLRPAQTVALGFAGAVLCGTVLLSLPLSLTRLEEMSLLDTLFIATSAVTVTGLIVYDPGTFLTPFGQGVLLVLIQLGGLGTMATSASLVVLAGRRLRLSSAAALQQSMDLETVGQVHRQLRVIIGATIATEVLGAGALYLAWRGHAGIAQPLWTAVFHAVSAFCNAGFSLFATNLQSFRDNLAINAVVATLVVLGGLGFPVLTGASSLAIVAWRRPRRFRLSLHLRLALVTTGLLLGGGAVLALVLEFHGALAALTWPSRLAAAVFLSVTARTAGFSTLDTAGLAPATLWVLMLLMIVGGCPGSTAGGIKTTTAATVAATLWTTARGRARVEVFRRTIPEEQVSKALALVGVSFVVVALASALLLATQAAEPLSLIFEAASAFGTVGLTTGVTPDLNAWGKLVIIATMFVGRVGPLTLGFAMAARRRATAVAYPPEKILIG